MKRREMLRTLGSGTALGLFPNMLSTQIRAQPAREAVRPFTVRGTGPAVIAFDREPRGYYDQLTDRHRVVVIADPSFDNSPAGMAPLTADRLCGDILAVADRAGIDRFAWDGFSFGSVVGLPLASRTIGSGNARVGARAHLLPQYSFMAGARGRIEVYMPAHGIRRKRG